MSLVLTLVAGIRRLLAKMIGARCPPEIGLRYRGLANRRGSGASFRREDLLRSGGFMADLKVIAEKAINDLATGLLPTLIDQLSLQHPGLVFELALGDPPTLQKRDLLGRKVEVAIMRSEAHELEEGL